MLPDDAEVAGWLPRLGVAPGDAAALFANRPSPDRYAAVAEYRDDLVARIGVPGGKLAWPDESGSDTYFYAWTLLSALPDIRRYHAGFERC